MNTLTKAILSDTVQCAVLQRETATSTQYSIHAHSIKVILVVVTYLVEELRIILRCSYCRRKSSDTSNHLNIGIYNTHAQHTIKKHVK